MKKTKGVIYLEIRYECPHCKEIQYTDNEEFRKEFTEKNEIPIHHDNLKEMECLVVKCSDCGEEFEIEKVTYNW
jgi:hypothetical protein